MRKRYYQRFHWTQIVEHWVMALSFVTLATTGLPQKFSDTTWAHAIAEFFGGVQMLREIHHIAAIVLILTSIVHFVGVGYRVLVLQTPLYMWMRWRDLRDLLQAIGYYLKLAPSYPRFERYGFIEKLEYWALIWGTVLMIVTGFILWNPIWFTSFLPGEIVPAAKAAHGYEAVLAVLAILTWHVYFVHFRHFNKSIFTGKLSEEEIAHEHPLELERLQRGEPPAPSAESVARRRRVFVPVATFVVLFLLAGTFYMITVEQTAIETVALPGRAPTIPHALELRGDCLACHNLQTQWPFPIDHTGRGNESCLSCHWPAK